MSLFESPDMKTRAARETNGSAQGADVQDEGSDEAPSHGKTALPSAKVARIVGCTALSLWFAIFVAGLLLSSSRYRDALLPPAVRATSADLPALGGFPNFATAFVVIKAALTFSPINIGLLCVAAGLVGGCAANLNWYNLERLGATKKVSARTSVYLTEHPANAVLRSFLIYLLLMAGLLAFMPDPFKLLQPVDPSVGDVASFLRDLAIQQSSYTRLAALASVLSFMVGYDPSRFDGLFELVPRIGNGGSSTTTPAAPNPSPNNAGPTTH